MSENTVSKKILIVDDEPDIIEFLQYNLKREGFKVFSANDGRQAIAIAEAERPDLIILDIMMPELDGVETCRILRSKKDFDNVPIAFLTARDEDFSQITALDVGGDDYITKPFSIEELVLRISVILKRIGKNTAQPAYIQSVGQYLFDSKNLKLSHSLGESELTQREAELLGLLFLHKNNVVSREKILVDLWGEDDYFKGRSLDVFITRLRKYLCHDTSLKIVNVHGVGFRLECQ